MIADPILRGNGLAHTVLRAVDDCPPHGIERPQTCARCDLLTAERDEALRVARELVERLS